MSFRDEPSGYLRDYYATQGLLNNERFALAFHLWELGFSVIPLSPWTKRPATKWKPFQTERAMPHQLKAWFLDNDFRPGIVTGSVSGVVVVDCDASDVIPENIDVDSSSVTQATKHGVHHVYRHDGTRSPNRQRVEGEPIDVRGDGGYIVAYADSLDWTAEAIEAAPVYCDDREGVKTYDTPQAEPDKRQEAIGICPCVAIVAQW